MSEKTRNRAFLLSVKVLEILGHSHVSMKTMKELVDAIDEAMIGLSDD